MAIKTLSTPLLQWVNIDSVDEEALTYLKEKHDFHPLDLEDVQGESQIPKLDTYKDYLFLVFQFPQWSSSLKEIGIQELDIFIGDGYLITIQHTKSAEMKNFFYRCMKNSKIEKEWMSSSAGYLLYNLLEALIKEMRPILTTIGKEIDVVEQEIFHGKRYTLAVKELALHRRNILQFRRIIDPQRYIITNLSHIRKAFLNEETSLYFDDINDSLDKVWVIMDAYKDTIQGLHVTVESLINQRTNKVIGTLTVISVALLPFTVISSIYGMNIQGLPYAEHPSIVWAMFGGLAIFVFVVIVIMRRQKWL